MDEFEFDDFEGIEEDIVNTDIDIDDITPNENLEENFDEESTGNDSTIDIYKPFITNGTEKEEILVIEDDNANKKEVKLHIPPTPTLEHEKKMWDTINNFDKRSWSNENVAYTTGFPEMDKAFGGGLRPGFILIAGDSNIGKTAIISQMAWQVGKLNDNVYVMDYSLDDAMEDKLSRVFASNGRIPMNAVKDPKDYISYPSMLARRIKSMNDIRNMIDRYRTYDATDTTFVEEIEEEVVRIKIELDKNDIKKQIILFIDNFHDLNSKDKPNLQDKQKYDYLAQFVSDMAIKHNIIIVCTAELRKLSNSNKRPTPEDLRESVKIKYEAKAILMCYNDVHYKGEGAEIYYNRKGYTNKQPVFEIHFAKNKFNSFKGRTFYEFFPDLAYMSESDKTATKTYQSLIFGG